MLANRANTQRRKAYCLYCACQGRSYSQGHSSNAALSLTETTNDHIKQEAAVVEPRLTKCPTPVTLGSAAKLTDVSCFVDEGVRTKLQVGLGETTNLLDSLYSTKYRRHSPPRASMAWSTSIQAFDVIFQRGSSFLRNIRALETPEIESVPDHITDAPSLKVKKNLKRTNRKRDKGAMLFNVYQKSEAGPSTTKKETDRKQKTTRTMDQLFKIKLFSQQMSSFLKMCGQQGQLDNARSMMNTCLINSDSFNKWFTYRKIVDTSIPNVLTRCYAAQGRLGEAMTLHNAIIDIGVAPNIETYVWLLWAALGSKERKGKTKEILDIMSSRGVLHLLGNAVNHPSLKAYPTVMSRLREEMMSLHPELHMEPKKKGSKVPYCNVLVNDLNEAKVVQNPSAGIIPPDKASVLMTAHMAMELDGQVEVESILRVDSTQKAFEPRSKYQSMLDSWRETLTKEFTNLLKTLDVEAQEDIHTLRWVMQFLHCMPVDLYVSVMMRESERLCEMSEFYSPNLLALGADLGEAVRRKYYSYIKSSSHSLELEAMHRRYIEKYNADNHSDSFRGLYESIDEHSLLDASADDIWPSAVTKKLGEMLYKLVMNSLTVPSDILKEKSEEPVLAFYTVLRWESTKCSKQVKPHPSIVSMVEAAQLRRLFMNVDSLPVLVPPVPWIDQMKGPFLLSNNQLVRSTRENYFDESTDEEILPVLDALNVLGATPWRVNNDVFPHLMQVFNSGGDSRLKIPVSQDKVTIPEEDSENLSEEEAEALLNKSKAEAYSERMSFTLGLSVANHYKNNTFWLPHDLDFRGRAYPLSRYFSQVSSDSLRSIMTFAKGKPLGERGLQWLKIHLVNLSGFKKRESNASRLAYADEVLPLAFQSAADPLKGEQWWMTFDSPWQGLAACMELKAAYDSGDPVNYLSTLPIHQDGSCNGLQHYAALGCDKIGAASVNVSPADVPHDTYQDVANIVELLRAKDAANGDQLAKLLEGQITRKVVKQTVMTKVYGVTPYGSQLQIHKHLSAQSPDLGAATLDKASVYIANKLAESMASMFISSTEIQNWFLLCAHQLTSVTGKPICWKTPLGLSVTQNYWTKASKGDKAKCLEGPYMDDLRHDSYKEKPDVNQQKGGFPPNFIHSLDATHMMLTALRCHRASITFASIHDCFWTHADNVDTMNKICRESFYDLYKQPILNKLSDYFMEHYVLPDNPEHSFLERVVRSVPAKGELDLSVVKESDYFFS